MRYRGKDIELIGEKMVLVKVGQALADVAYVLETVVLADETHVKHHTAADTAREVAVRLLDAVVPFITPGLGLYLSCDMKCIAVQR